MSWTNTKKFGKQKIHLRLNAKEEILIPKRKKENYAKKPHKKKKESENKLITRIHRQTNLTNSKNRRRERE
jgi:hypothetical protein